MRGWGVAAARAGLCSLALFGAACGKFQQARECGTFVKTVNAWLASPEGKPPPDAGASSDPQQIASEARRTAEHYASLGQSLAALHIQSEELGPRVKRYREIADSAALALRDVATALDHGDLETARKKRVEFDSIAQTEGPLVKSINGICR